jgi:hypothetical protein
VVTWKSGALVLLVIFLAGPAMAGDAVPNWSAPASWSPSSAARGVTAQSDISEALPFIAVTPCRQYDSRNTSALPDNTNRSITLTGAPCSIPAGSTGAVSVNITVFSITGAGGNGVFQVGTAADPTFAWINYPPTETQRGNAGAVPLNFSGQIVVKENQGGGSLHFTVDVNGYYAMSSSGYFQQFIFRSRNVVVDALLVDGTGVPLAAGDLGWNIGPYGVLGRSFVNNTDSGGVRGQDATGPPGGTGKLSAGVRGESGSNFGVLGLSRFAGVDGELLDSNGGFIAGGILGTTFGVASDNASPPWGVFSVGNLGVFGMKHFVEPHWSDPAKIILYSSLEGREAGTYFRGTARTVKGEAVIEVPEDFRTVTDEEGLTVQLTAIGAPPTMYVDSEDLHRVVVRSSRDLTFHYLVQGVRRAFKDFEPVARGMEFAPRSPDDRMPAYLTEEAKRRLIANGTYNPDGTVNMQTAERVGWTRIWKEREERDRAAAAANAAANATARDASLRQSK